MPCRAINEEPDQNRNVPSEDANIDGVRVVRKSSLEVFKGRLIEHFDTKWRRNEIVWSQQLPMHQNPEIIFVTNTSKQFG